MWTEWQWVNGKPDLAGVRSLLHDYGSVRQAFFLGLVGSKDLSEAEILAIWEAIDPLPSESAPTLYIIEPPFN